MNSTDSLFYRFSESYVHTPDNWERFANHCLYPLHNTLGHYFCQIEKEYNPCVKTTYELGLVHLIKALLVVTLAAPLILIGKWALDESRSHRQARERLVKLLKEPDEEYLQGTFFEHLSDEETTLQEPSKAPMVEKPIDDILDHLTPEELIAALRPDPSAFSPHPESLPFLPSPFTPKPKTPFEPILEQPAADAEPPLLPIPIPSKIDREAQTSPNNEKETLKKEEQSSKKTPSVEQKKEPSEAIPLPVTPKKEKTPQKEEPKVVPQDILLPPPPTSPKEPPKPALINNDSQTTPLNTLPKTPQKVLQDIATSPLHEEEENEKLFNSLFSKVLTHKPDDFSKFELYNELIPKLKVALFSLPKEKIVNHMVLILKTSHYVLWDFLWDLSTEGLVELIEKLRKGNELKPFFNIFKAQKRRHLDLFNALVHNMTSTFDSQLFANEALEVVESSRFLRDSFYTFISPAGLKASLNNFYPEIPNLLSKKFRIMQDLLRNWKLGEFQGENVRIKQHLANMFIQGLEIQSIDSKAFPNELKSYLPVIASCKILCILRNSKLQPTTRQKQLNDFLHGFISTHPKLIKTTASELVCLCSTEELAIIMDVPDLKSTSLEATSFRKYSIPEACFTYGDMWLKKVAKMCEQFKTILQKKPYEEITLTSSFKHIQTKDTFRVVLKTISAEFGHDSKLVDLLTKGQTLQAKVDGKLMTNTLVVGLSDKQIQEVLAERS